MSKKRPVRKAKGGKAKGAKKKTIKPLPIVADANVYGTYARISALADFVEVCALKRVVLKKQQLADLIGDNGWQLQELVVRAVVADALDADDDGAAEDPDEVLPVAQDVATDAADRVFSTIAERSAVLGDRYPFRINGERVVLKQGFRVRESPYVSILAIAISHTFKLSSNPAPTQVLEEVVGDVLKRRVHLGINFGRLRRERSPFTAAVAAACPLLQLTPSTADALISARAQDENVDTIGHVHWGDGRPGTWCFIGQVTCARSDDWEKKLNEPLPATWSRLLGVQPHPMVFLAVPHHVEKNTFARLVQGERGIVLDRLRLAMNKVQVDKDERKLVAKMLGAKLEPF